MLNRRHLMLGGLGLTALSLLPGMAAAAEDNGSAAKIAEFTGGKTPADGKLSLTMPEIAENGNTVPLTVEVDSPMTADDHVTEVLVVATRNPAPEVARFEFQPGAGLAKANTRMRLAETQDVIALARTSTGAVYQSSQTVKVTIGGCGG